ncbi:MAG TPA: DUF4157 domain-containing protein [Pyrinomonadaceae bacterium]
MKLAPESHKQIESFLREHLKDETLVLPPIHIYSGWYARWLTEHLRILAITFGRRIFIAPKVLKLDEQNRLTAPAGLIAHESTHVIQYAQVGIIGFFVSYLREYFRILREQKQGWGRAARNAAYLGIRHEREAYKAEEAYPSWIALVKISVEEGKETLPALDNKTDEG